MSAPVIVTDWRAVPPEARGATLALGNLDGVHQGHAAVLAAAHQARPDLALGALTFEPHPREHFRPDDPPFRLTLLPAKASALGAAGARLVVALPFGPEMAAMSARDFVEQVLHHGLDARHLACGPDFAFGHRRGGDVGFLRQIAEELGIGLSIVPHVADGEGTISSTRIRRLLQDGYPERAAALLGRPFAIVGPVTHGDARGRTIGFPTANIPLGRHLEPARGVYAVRATLPDGRVVPGVANLGRRPTLGGDPISRLEAHLFDLAEDLYGQELSVALIAFIREERKFPDFPALVAQIQADAATARRLLGA
ncbi:riboflavin biosynthesis protein RibF [Roseococcus sp. SDR]|uniref:riboflavin biosynthesis protein RibF n=1 Tax=Roseococcus sp. SDR TaxID=2835532 RepID=UPI001BCE1A80|nr:riboflavin biosynthesis protein RibF [Roseococcus sp. SDR]MBS7788572.1 riboflavin biosynthesis protein RibF [Roseococcus sp. SDR]MBV1843886.1 riboflavin biosynthesis protein RibF [Roseococcus sp. SDR]